MRKLTIVPGDNAVPADGYENQPYVRILNVLMPQVIEVHGQNAYDTEIHHDDECPALLSDGFCRCNPDVMIRVGGPDGKLVAQCLEGQAEVLD